MKRVPAEGLVGRARLREAATSELTQVMNLVRAALQARYDAAKKPTESYAWFDIEAMYADRVIVCKDGRYWQFDYAIDAANVVQLQEPREVIEQFLPVALKEALQIRVAGGGNDAFLLEAAGTDGKAYEAVLIRAGLAKNSAKSYYPDATLREAAPLFNDVRMYELPDEDHLQGKGKSVRNVVGWVSDARFVEGAEPDTGYVAGRVNLVAGELRDKIADAWSRGKKNLVALSIDAFGKGREVRAAMREAAGGAKRLITAITKVKSVDVILDASAGGALVRLVEAADPEAQGDMKLKERMLATIKEKNPALHAKINADTVSDEELEGHYREALGTPAKQGAPATDIQAGPVMTRADFDGYVKLREAREAAAKKINATTLPAPIKEVLVTRFNRLERFTEADVDAEIKNERELVVRVAESLGMDRGKVKLDTGDIQVEDRSLKMAQMLDAFFDPAHKDHARVHSMRECYIEITGDTRVTGRWEDCDRSRLREAVGDAYLRESLDSTSWGNVLGNAITRRMVADYRQLGQWDVWRMACDRVPVSDFRTNERTRVGGYGDLPIVNEGNPYTALASPGDEKATYGAKKRGGTEDFTWEMLRNDDVGAIRRIPIQLSRTSKRTLCKFVLDFVATNPVIYDGLAFFHATHGNLGAAALDAVSLAARRLAMKKQTELGSVAKISIGPKFLWVPDDLEQTSVDLFSRNTNNDKTFVQSLSLTVMPVPYWTDPNDWAISADVADMPGIEIGFLDGNEEPTLFVQDSPTVGSLFTNDKITYKIRHVYGGNVIDFRSWDKSVV